MSKVSATDKLKKIKEETRKFIDKKNEDYTNLHDAPISPKNRENSNLFAELKRSNSSSNRNLPFQQSTSRIIIPSVDTHTYDPNGLNQEFVALM